MISRRAKGGGGDGIISRKSDKGFGFIALRDTDRDLFFHSNELMNITFDELEEGDRVVFDIAQSKKGPNAINVGRNGLSNDDEEVADDGVEQHPEVRIAIENVSKLLAEIVARDPISLDKLEWRDLERVIAEVFSALGFDVELTPGSKDGGKDVIVSFPRAGEIKTYLIEVKHWRSGKRVGDRPVVEFLHVIAREDRSGGLLLATHGFSNGVTEALTEIDRGHIALGTGKKVVSLCRTYVKAREGLWCPPEQLDEVIFDETLSLRTN